MLAIIIGICAIIIGLQMMAPRERPARLQMIPAGRPAKIMGIVHVVCGALLIGYIVVNIAVHFYENRPEDMQSGGQSQIEN